MANKWIKVLERVAYKMQNMTEEEKKQAKQITDTIGYTFKTVQVQREKIQYEKKAFETLQHKQLEEKSLEVWKCQAKAIDEHIRGLFKGIDETSITAEQTNSICRFLDIQIDTLKTRYNIK